MESEADVLEWPQHRRHRLSSRAWLPPQWGVISDEISANPDLAVSFKAVVDGVNSAFGERADPDAALLTLTDLANSAAIAGGGVNDTSGENLLALACAEALRATTSADMWEHVRALRWHSGALEQHLGISVAAIAQADPLFKERFLAVAKDVVEIAATSPGRRAIAREQATARQSHDDWIKNPSLTALWQLTIQHGAQSVDRDDDGILSIVADIDIGAFVELARIFKTPYAVYSALFRSGASWSFERWQGMLAASPPAFDENRCWTGSTLAPLLLGIGLDQLRFPLRADASDDEVAEATKEATDLTNEIAKIVAARPDGAPCAERWAAWLMRSSMAGVSDQATPHPTDLRSGGYVAALLLDTLARTPLKNWSPISCAHAEPWEPWCYRAAVTCVALIQQQVLPSTQDFLIEWDLTPEDWTLERGQRLRAHASMFEVFGKRPDAYGTRVLALNLVEADEPASLWRQLWRSANTLREIVEFGDQDDEFGGGWQGRSDASGLLKLVFGLGLMMVDHLITPSRDLICDRRAALESILPALIEAVREMTAIDSLNTIYWKECARHLAIRRAVWLSGRAAAQGLGDIIILDDLTAPTLADFVSDLNGDTEGLLGFIDAAVRNGVDRSALKTALNEAAADLNSEILLAERLLELAPKRAGISAAQIELARSILSETI